MEKLELRLAGSGGQGVILASIILAEAAINADRYACQSQSYGPEARGGACKAETIISDQQISYPKIIVPGFLMALTQKAADKYAVNLQDDAIVVLDSRLEVPESARRYKVYQLPILDTAEYEVGKALTANIVAVGVINRILNICSPEQLSEAVLKRIPKGSEEMNMKALQAGMNMDLGE